MDLWLFRLTFEVSWLDMDVSFCVEINLLADAFWRPKGRCICILTRMVHWCSWGPWEDGSISDWSFGGIPSDRVSDHLLSCLRLNLDLFSFGKRHDVLWAYCCSVQLSFSVQLDQDLVWASEYFRGNALVIVGLDHFIWHFKDALFLPFSLFFHLKWLFLFHLAVIQWLVALFYQALHVKDVSRPRLSCKTFLITRLLISSHATSWVLLTLRWIFIIVVIRTS